MLRRSGQSRQTPLHLRLGSLYRQDVVLVELITAGLNRIENLVILHLRSVFEEPLEPISDAPILRMLEMNCNFNQPNAFIPFVSPKYALKLLESIQITRGGTVEVFLHALREMPLLEDVGAMDMFNATPLQAPSEIPIIKLCFLQKLNPSGNDALCCSQILDSLSFPASARIYITRPYRSHFESDADMYDGITRLSASVTSKAAGHDLLGTVIPVHTLFIRRHENNYDDGPTVFIWTDDPTTHGVHDPRLLPIPPTPPFCECTISYNAGNALEVVCSARPHDLGSIQTVIMSCYNSDDLWYDSERTAPVSFWSDSLRCLVGLESLHLECMIWDEFATTLTPVGAAERGTVLAELPFPQLRLLSLSCISFRLNLDAPRWPTPSYHAEQYDFILILKEMLASG